MVSRRVAVPERERGTFWIAGDPEAVRPLVRGEGTPVFMAGVLLALLALGVCYRHGYTLLYGDAVAHLGNSRRILDAHYPGLSQLGGAWLPLPHVLMLPFIGNMAMWQTGLAGAPMSMLGFAASVVGVWRLARRMMRLRWALVATLLYALNPNLLYLATTAMTEALFLALFVWSVVAAVEGAAAIGVRDAGEVGRNLLLAGLLVLLMVLTRYDGWVIGAAVWACLAWQLVRAEQTLRRQIMPAFVTFTILCAAGPLLWFWYNAHFDGDWLDFLRGPYSAKQIERRTAPPGQHYRGWHNPGWSALFYTRTAQVDAAAWETGFGLMLAAWYGAWVSWCRTHLGDDKAVAATGYPEGAKVELPVHSRGEGLGLLLWLPLPFYIYSVAYGSVPIFIPQLWPHAFYNARYGMELLPALCVYGALAAEQFESWLRQGGQTWRLSAAKGWQPMCLGLCLVNSGVMMATTPLVLREGLVNARARVPFEHSLAEVIETMPKDQPVLMSVSAHVGAVQDAGRDLRSVVSENDEIAWRAALRDPAGYAAYVIALEGDPVGKAVAAHPTGLTEIEVVRTIGQPTARVYQSQVYRAGR